MSLFEEEGNCMLKMMSGSEVAFISRKCRWLSVVAMFAVIIIHCNSIGTFADASYWNRFFQQAFSRVGTSWAVPMFFVISGYWAYQSLQKETYRKLIRKKVRGLLVPYVCWAVLGALIVLPLICFNNMVMHRTILERTVFAQSSVWSFCDALLGITRGGPMGNLALWYVRTLMLLFLFSPIEHIIVCKLRWWALFISLILILVCPKYSIPFMSIESLGVGCFLLGMSLGELGLMQRQLPRLWTIGIGLAWFVGVIIWTRLSILEQQPTIPFQYSIPLLGGLMWFGLYDWFGERIRFSVLLERKTFWVYCLHGVLVGYFVSGGYFILGKTNAVSIILALLSPVLVLAVCWGGVLFARGACRVSIAC